MVEEIPERNLFTSNSIRRYPILSLLIKIRSVNPTARDPQFWKFRNHPSVPCYNSNPILWKGDNLYGLFYVLRTDSVNRSSTAIFLSMRPWSSEYSMNRSRFFLFLLTPNGHRSFPRSSRCSS